jgi:hypothetical protein
MIGTAAAPVLVEQGTAPKELIEWRSRNHELKELFLKHMLMIVDVHTTLALATTNNDITLRTWKQGQELHDRVTVREAGKHEQLPVRPDGFFTLEDARRPAGQNRFNYFLEADRSTTTHERFQKKVTAYWRYFQQGGHTQKYNIKTFRVVTVTLTKERADNLCQATQEMIPKPARRLFLFSSLKDFSVSTPEKALQRVFTNPHDDSYYSLVPDLELSPVSA